MRNETSKRYFKNSNKVEVSDLFPKEAVECLDSVLAQGAEKYAPHDWEQPNAQSIEHPKNCNAMFHHLAREYVYLENKGKIEALIAFADFDAEAFRETALELCRCLKYDEEFNTRHLQHVATRSIMSYTREKRGLK